MSRKFVSYEVTIKLPIDTYPDEKNIEDACRTVMYNARHFFHQIDDRKLGSVSTNSLTHALIEFRKRVFDTSGTEVTAK